MSKQLCYAACSFGLEAVVARQLEQLGLEEVHSRDARDFAPKTPEGTVFSNPPYAIRMGEKKQVRELYRDMGTRLRGLAHFKSYFICADEQFESAYGKQADKKRKLYNGNIKCTFYQYFRSE